MGDESNGPAQENHENEASASPETLRILEAVLYASDEVMSAARLKTILPGEPDARTVRRLVDKVNVLLERERHPFEIVGIGGGYQFRTIAHYQPWVQQIVKERNARKLSIQALECLAVIAYRQPITKAQVEAVRGVLSDGAMKTLLERRMITIAGHSDKPGRPLLYGTTQEFLEYFNINKLNDLPKVEEFEAIAREKMQQLTEHELEQLDLLAGPSTEPHQTSGVEVAHDAPDTDVSTNPPDTSAPNHREPDDNTAPRPFAQAQGSPTDTDAQGGDQPPS